MRYLRSMTMGIVVSMMIILFFRLVFAEMGDSANKDSNPNNGEMFNRKVMIVDDNKEFLRELEETLSFSGYDTIAEQDPHSVLAIASREKPHAIILDLKMPGKSGFKLAHELKSSPGLQQIPIIAMSESFKDGYQMLMNMCGIKRCLKKPFNPLNLIAEIEAVVE